MDASTGLLYYNGINQFGIGTSVVNSAYKLNINGDVNFTGSLYKSGTAYDLTTFITTSTANSTYQTITGMSSYLTTSTANSTYQPKNAKNTYLYVSYSVPDTVAHQNVGERLVLYQETTPYFNSSIGVSISGGLWLSSQYDLTSWIAGTNMMSIDSNGINPLYFIK